MSPILLAAGRFPRKWQRFLLELNREDERATNLRNMSIYPVTGSNIPVDLGLQLQFTFLKSPCAVPANAQYAILCCRVSSFFPIYVSTFRLL